MITINPRVACSVPASLLERLGRIPPATIGHLSDFGFMDGGLRPIGRRGFAMCGPAVTVRTMSIDSSVVHAAISIAQEGDVLVIDRNGDGKHAAWGEMTSLAAHLRGLAGTLIDGPATDIVEIEELGYLVFSRGISPITTRGLALSGEINTSVVCGGVTVNPGDIILADDNGVLVLPPEMVAEVVERCEPRVEREAMIRRRLHAGEQLADITGAHEKLRAARDG